MTAPQTRLVTFIQYDEPPLKSGEYRLTVTHATNQAAPYDKFTESREFAVAGRRFALGADQVISVFPPDLASGEFEGVLPHVVLSKRTLPWERASIPEQAEAPWLAVLTFAGSELKQDRPAQSEKPVAETSDKRPAETKRVTVKELIPKDKSIGVAGSDTTATGALEAGIVSYPMPDPDQKFDYKLDYGESPADCCNVIDIPVELFSRIAPCKADLSWLAHVREVDTVDSEDHPAATLQAAIVVGNRVGVTMEQTFAFLVSLERMEDYLPDAEGGVADKLKGASKVRLVVLRQWRYTANKGAKQFRALVENLNKVNGAQQLTTLRLPGATPFPADVSQAMANQALGTMSDDNAATLTANALAMGYVALDHRLRHSGNLVSWYRGPLAPYAIGAFIKLPQPSADTMARYNPQTGMFDMSYAAAWQLGQLMALQSSGFATTVYAWKKGLMKAEAAQAEIDLITRALKHLPADPDGLDDPGGALPAAAAPRSHAFAYLLATRMAHAQGVSDAIPDTIVDWISKLRLLNGVPFAYLVPDERMLPPESLRFFHLDPNWMEALVDGALSIGRATVDDINRDAVLRSRLHQPVIAAVRKQRRNPRPVRPAAASPSAAVAEGTQVADASSVTTGFLLRSQVLKGWPRLQVNGYRADGTEADKFRLVLLSADIMLALFDGELARLSLHEPPEQLHFGVENGSASLRALLDVSVGSPKAVSVHPGEQFPGDAHLQSINVALPLRANDQQTIKVDSAAAAIRDTLNGSELNPDPKKTFRFTSAEFALEMIKGVDRIEFKLSSNCR